MSHNIKNLSDINNSKVSLKKELSNHYQASAHKNSIYYQQVQNKSSKNSYRKQRILNKKYHLKKKRLIETKIKLMKV